MIKGNREFRVWSEVDQSYSDAKHGVELLEYPDDVVKLLPLNGRVLEQVTGLFDGENREIFEGDVLLAEFRTYRAEGGFKLLEKGDFRAYVRFESVMFTAGDIALDTFIKLYPVKIIGTIHDNQYKQ